MSCCISSTLCDPATGAPVIVALDIGDGITTYVNSDGTPWPGDPATLVACIPEETALVVTTDGNATGVGQSGNVDHIVDLVVTDPDAANLLTVGPGGGSFLDCAAIAACDTGPDLVVTTDGDATGVAQSGTNDHTVNIIVTSTDTDNLISVGADGGSFLDCDAIAACSTAPEFNKVGSDGTVSAFDSAVDCVPEFAFQQILDHHGHALDAAAKASVLNLHRTIGVGPDTHLPGAELGVLHSDSDDAGITGITTHHQYAVSTSVTSTATGQRSHVIASRDSTASGVETFIGAGVRVNATGQASAIIGSGDSSTTATFSAAVAAAGGSVASGVASAVISSEASFASAQGATTISALNSTASGLRSFAAGEDSLASGLTSFVAGGRQNSATDADAFASGFDTTASGAQSATFGNGSVASGIASFASGNLPVASGLASAAFGLRSEAQGPQCFAMGTDCVAVTFDDFAGGQGSVASGTQSFAFGFQAIASGDDAVAFSHTSIAADDLSFACSHGEATVGQAGTFAHGNGSPGFAGTFLAATCVGFRGAVPQPARTLTTLADVILALQEQGLGA